MRGALSTLSHLPKENLTAYAGCRAWAIGSKISSDALPKCNRKQKSAEEGNDVENVNATHD